MKHAKEVSNSSLNYHGEVFVTQCFSSNVHIFSGSIAAINACFVKCELNRTNQEPTEHESTIMMQQLI